VRAVGSVVRQAGWCREGISREALEKLRTALVEAGHIDKLDLPGLSEERRPVFVGGVAVLSALFEDLGIEQMTVSDWALREGLIFDLIGRIRHEDVRERTIGALLQRYLVDTGQARRVAKTAQGTLAQVASAWGMKGEEPEQLLGWAAQLHEIGLAIAHSGYHKHGAYLVEHSDLPGFSTREQRRLAALVRGHRRKFPQGVFKGFPKAEAELLSRLCLLLRLSVLLQRSRIDAPLPAFEVRTQKQGLSLQFPEGWLEAHPLTHADLGQEAEYLRAAGLKLEFA
jgi:exopolyphosphatase/guanosine-5'-triphosphate,3'-diphosphate pyrophosphatase